MAIITLNENNLPNYYPYIGRCLVNYDIKHLWVNIPKNGSNTVSGHLLKLNWKDDNWFDNKNLLDFKKTVVLRDPINRWKGSVIELCYHHLEHNHWSFDNFDSWFVSKDFQNFDKWLDIHFLPQSSFLYNLVNNISFVPMDANFNNCIREEFVITGPIQEKNITKNNSYKLKIIPCVESLMSNSDLLEKIKTFYQEDYKLIDNLKFYNLL